jgi:hypothetical protein
MPRKETSAWINRVQLIADWLNNGTWELRYSFHVLGILDDRTNKITSAKNWHEANLEKCKASARSNM